MLGTALRSLIVLLLLPLAAGANDITSVSPSAVTPGAQVTITGGPFSPGVEVVLGERAVAPTLVGDRQLVFTVPSVLPGDYALFLRSGEQTSSRAFLLRVLEPTPAIVSVNPSSIDECADPAERRILIEGRNFLPEAALLLDGAGVGVSERTEDHVVFHLPPLPGGIHEVQVVNPGGQKSLPAALYVNSIPDILSVSQGADYVVAYDLIITGKNFLYTSALVVNGKPVARTGLNLSAGEEPAPAPAGVNLVQYVDCNTLIYRRYPYSRDLKRISLQVINPGGMQSPIFHVTAP